MAKANFPLKKRIELVEQCFEFVKTGQPVGRFADSIGIPRTTLYGWLRRYSKMAARDRNTDNRMVPVTRHSSPLPAIVPFRNELPSPETENGTSGKAISIDLGYCRVDIPQGCVRGMIILLEGGEDIFLDSKRRRECIRTKRERKPLNFTLSLTSALMLS